MRRVFLAAAPNVRALCPPHLVEGYEAEVGDGLHSLTFMLTTAPVGVPGTDPGHTPPSVTLEARHNGGKMRGLPFWEVRRRGEW